MSAVTPQPKLVLRKRAGSATWYIQWGKTRKSTGFSEHEKAEAEQLLRSFISDLQACDLVDPQPSRIAISVVLDAALEMARRQVENGGCSRPAFNSLASQIRVLRLFWGDMDIYDYNQSSVDRYVDQRLQAADCFQHRIAVSSTSAFAELSNLRRFINKYTDTHGIDRTSRATLVEPTALDRHLVSRSELARILYACRGYRWDEDNAVMVKRSPGRFLSVVKTMRRHIARMFILAAYTGSRGSCVYGLAWSKSESGDQSYVDIEHDPPLLYRLGPDVGPGKMREQPVFLGRRISNHLRIWHEADLDRGQKYIAGQQFGDQRMVNYPSGGIKNVLIDAGLHGSMFFDDVRFSAIHYLAESEAPAISISIFVGARISEFMARFEHLRPDFQDDIVKAFSRMRSSPLDT